MKIIRAISIITLLTLLFIHQGCNSIYSYKTTYNYFTTIEKDIENLCDFQVKRIEQRGELYLVSYHKNTCCISSTRDIYLTFKKEFSELKLYSGENYFITEYGFDSSCYKIIKNEVNSILNYLSNNIAFYEITQDWILLSNRLCYFTGNASNEIDSTLYFQIEGKYYYQYHESEIDKAKVKQKIMNWRPN